MLKLVKHDLKFWISTLAIALLPLPVYLGLWIISADLEWATTISSVAFGIATIILFVGALVGVSQDFDRPTSLMIALIPVRPAKFLAARIISLFCIIAFWLLLVLLPYLTFLETVLFAEGMNIVFAGILNFNTFPEIVNSVIILLQFIIIMYFAACICGHFGLKGFFDFVVFIAVIIITYTAANWLSAGTLLIAGVRPFVYGWTFNFTVGGAMVFVHYAVVLFTSAALFFVAAKLMEKYVNYS